MEMPPPGRGKPLTREQIGVLRAWIDQGVPWESTRSSAELKPEFYVSPTLRWIGVHGNAQVFQEHHWVRKAWNGGAEHFRFHDKLTNGVDVSVTGHAWRDDYKVAFDLDKAEVGFAHFGFTRYRKYFDNSGGYSPLFKPSAFTLDRALGLDIGRAWVDLGLTLPNWPQLTLGYEYQYKDGAKSTLEWGPVGTIPAHVFGTDVKNIYPAYKEVNEHVHILKLDVTHNIKGVSLEDSFRAEFYNLETRRNNVSFYDAATDNLDRYVIARDSYNYFQAANTFRLEKQLKDWLFLSGGYLYTHHDGTAGLNVTTLLTPTATTGFASDDNFWTANAIVLEQQTHVLNYNVLLGPWKGLAFTASLQNEWMDQDGLGRANLEEQQPTGFPENNVLLRADLDKFSADERFAVRYTQIPFTVLFAETRFQQESYGQFEQQGGGHHDFLRDTDASSDLKEYRGGFSVSPWSRVSFNAQYRHQNKSSAYDHLRDLAFVGQPFEGLNEGYSAFIRSRQIESDQVEAKLVLRPARWLKTTLSYQLLTSDYHTDTDPAFGGFASPGGTIFAGNYDASIYSVNATITPWRRLYLSTTLSYRDSRTATAQNQIPSVVPYRGDVYSVLSSATLVLTPRTDWTASYSFSRAAYGQMNLVAGLPVGVDYDMHTIQTGFTRRLKKHAAVGLQYGYFVYREPTSAGLRDYTAQAVFATLSLQWP